MFPKVFETTVYTEQVTICPLDLFVNPPTSIYQPQAESEYIPPSQATIDTSICLFEREFSPPRNLPVPDFDSDRPQSSRKASNRKTRRPSKQKKDKNIVTAVATVGKKKPQSKAQRQQAIGRRKYPERPLVQCTVPGCEVDSTTEFRKRTHINGFHLGIKDNFCQWPGCTFATPYKSNVNRHYKRHLKKEDEKRKKLEALAALAARSYN